MLGMTRGKENCPAYSSIFYPFFFIHFSFTPIKIFDICIKFLCQSSKEVILSRDEKSKEVILSRDVDKQRQLGAYITLWLLCLVLSSV